MTGRRAVPTYEQRMSRALQFVPGHVGGRVASAQPIRRRGGTLRRQAVGAVIGGSPAPVPGDDPIFVWNPTIQDTEPEGQYFNLLESVGYQLPDPGVPIANMGVAVLISGPYLGTVTVDPSWTVLDQGTIGDLDYALVYRVFADEWDGIDDKLYCPGMDPVRICAAERWHWYDCGGMELAVAAKTTYEGASSVSLSTTTSPSLGGAFNVIQMTQTSGGVYPPFAVVSGDTTYAQLVSAGNNGPYGYMGIVYGHDGVAPPARAGAMGNLTVSSAAADTDWVSYSLGWGWA